MTLSPHFWMCLGIPPKIPPCGADGDKDTEAEKHTKGTGHSTTSGTPRGVEAIGRAITERTTP